ncbi:MAG: response regulator [Stigonema ocellatum SAG 48.90 = DSM 106950]|nr:response regulator [Stigonema ocellatum SAG 48.90 = DSM 106950]
MKTILVIEDNEAIRENLVELLDLLGFHAISAINALTGISLIEKAKPDLVFCDILMPNYDGYYVLGFIRSNAHYQKLPFYFISAKSEKADRQKAIKLGANGYLTKPFTEMDLLTCINRHLLYPSA